MQCPDCGYMMTAFDRECPRCRTLRESGPPPPSEAAPRPQADWQAQHEAARRESARIQAELAANLAAAPPPRTAPTPAPADPLAQWQAMEKAMDGRRDRERTSRSRMAAAPFGCASVSLLLMGLLLFLFFPVNLLFFALSLVLACVYTALKRG